MFKSLFGESAQSKLSKVVEIAFKEKTYIESMLEPLTLDGQIELCIFNMIYGWLYLKDYSIIEMISKNAENFNIIGLKKIKEFKPSLNASKFPELFKDRFINYNKELHLVLSTQFTNNEHYPVYFYRRIYNHPLTFEEIPMINKLDDKYYGDESYLDIYKIQINHLHDELLKAFN